MPSPCLDSAPSLSPHRSNQRALMEAVAAEQAETSDAQRLGDARRERRKQRLQWDENPISGTLQALDVVRS